MMLKKTHSFLATLPVLVMVWIIRGYQQLLRPFITVFLLSAFGYASQCKQTPTCSQYTIFQIRKHGTITGLKLGR